MEAEASIIPAPIRSLEDPLLRSLSLLLALSLAPTALAVPLHLQHSGRLADSSGVPLEGEHALLVTVYDGAGNALWSDTFTQEIGDGYFNVILGSGAPLSAEAFEGDDLYVGLSVDGEAELPVRFRSRACPSRSAPAPPRTCAAASSTPPRSG